MRVTGPAAMQAWKRGGWKAQARQLQRLKR